MKKRRFNIVPYLFVLPTMVLIFVFSYYAILDAVVVSFTDASIGFKQIFIGLANYSKLFQDAVFWQSFRNQAVLTVVSVFNSIFFPLLAAELLFFIRHRRVISVVKTAFVIPMLVPGIVTILTWRYLYNNTFGINTLLENMGLKSWQHNWLNDPNTALWAIIFVGFPFVSGLFFLIFHTGVNDIGIDLNEAAIIDGASCLRLVTSIHLPNVLPYVKVVFTLSLIGSLSGFGLVAATTGGGPGNATMIPAMYMYKVAFGEGNFGYASATGVMLFLVILALTLTSRRLFDAKKEVA